MKVGVRVWEELDVGLVDGVAWLIWIEETHCVQLLIIDSGVSMYVY